MTSVYSDTKVFHFPEKLRAIAEGRLTPPVHIRIKPTNTCTHHCRYCCYRNQDLPLSERMDSRDRIPWEKMRELIEDFGRMGVRAATFSGGGEPLCYPQIQESILAMLDAGVKVAMLTHGALLRGAVAELLARRATWIRVSMDAADPDLYASNRGVDPGEFERVCNNVRAFAMTPGRTCILGLNLIVNQENSGEVLAFLRMARELGADHVKVSEAVVSTDPEENEACMRPFFDTAKRQIAEGIATLQDGGFAIIDKLLLPSSEQEAFDKGYGRCPMAQCLTVIAADQNVYLCQDKAYTTAGLVGSIRDRSFAELWSSPETARKLRELDPRRDCRHHCVSHGKNLKLIDFFEADQEHLDFV